MDNRETYMNVKFTKTESRSPSRAGLNSTYSELNFRKEEPRIDEDEDPPIASEPGGLSPTASTDGETSTYTALNFGKDDGPSSTYSVLNFRKEEDLVHEYDDPPIASGPAELSVAPQAAVLKQESNIGNRQHDKICLFCLVTSILIAIVAGLSIYVLQIRQSQITSDRNYQLLWRQYQEMNRTQTSCPHLVHELNSSLESKTSENSHLNRSHSACLQNLSVLNNHISNIEKKFRTDSGAKAHICQLLTSSREGKCSKDWVKYGDRCYLFSTFETSYNGARQLCSIFDSSLLEINSVDETSFVYRALASRIATYWIGKCEEGKVASGFLYYVSYGTPVCIDCRPKEKDYRCNGDRRFICEKSALLCPVIPENIQSLCQQPVGAT
ncbi:uncharacterized protein [Mobula birostris]|uniref:uncharacterized protein isoform X2 n=1 Tax=Mobula birostris TaxID=1983395 RepID=UPI003B2871AD